MTDLHDMTPAELFAQLQESWRLEEEAHTRTAQREASARAEALREAEGAIAELWQAIREPLTSPPPPRVDPWIPVSERLPEKGVRVLFWLAGGPLEGGVLCTGALSKNEYVTVWLDDETNDDACIEWRTDDVTHWMPLPPPPTHQPAAGTEPAKGGSDAT